MADSSWSLFLDLSSLAVRICLEVLTVHEE